MNKKTSLPHAQIFRINKKIIKPATSTDQLNSLPQFKINKKSRIGILLIHGFSVTPSTWQNYLPTLEKNYSVYAPVLPGHSQTPEDLDKTTHQDWLKSVVAAYDLLAKDSQEIYCIGHSIGANLAMELSLQRPIKKLFLLSPALCLSLSVRISYWGVLIGRLFGLNFTVRTKAGDIKNHLHYVLGYREVHLKSCHELGIYIKKSAKILHQIQTDCLVFQAINDHGLSSKNTTKIFQKISAKNKQLILLDNCYHEIPLDNQGELVLQKILAEIKPAAKSAVKAR